MHKESPVNGTVQSTVQERQALHLVGIGVKHSIAPPMHNFIAKSLGLPWTFHSTECATIEDVIALARSPTTIGLVVTMPYKTSIMRHLDALDGWAEGLNACNNVYRDADGRLRGTNTDWRGIRGCLLQGAEKRASQKEAGSDGAQRPALVVGAGGAGRAAIFALCAQLGRRTVYVLNRDDQEVLDLMRDAEAQARLLSEQSSIEIVHVKSPRQAQNLETPYYVVGTIPDIEPVTESELAVKASLEEFLSRSDKGILLDMCFRPRQTRTIKMAEKQGWTTVEGIHVIRYQIEEQWRLWAGERLVKMLDTEAASEVLLKAAAESSAINF